MNQQLIKLERYLIFGSIRVKFVQDYLETERTESEFLHDVVALSRYIYSLPRNCGNLLRFKEASILMHNRIIAQLMDQYHSVGLHT